MAVVFGLVMAHTSGLLLNDLSSIRRIFEAPPSEAQFRPCVYTGSDPICIRLPAQLDWAGDADDLINWRGHATSRARVDKMAAAVASKMAGRPRSRSWRTVEPFLDVNMWLLV